MNIVKQLPLYGAALYPMTLTNNVINLVRDQGYIAISGRGICFVTRDQQGEVVMTDYIPFSLIFAWDCAPNRVTLTVSINDKREVIEMTSDQSPEVEKLLNDYTKHLCANSNTARALNDFEVDDPSLLSFKQGDEILILEKDDSGWYTDYLIR